MFNSKSWKLRGVVALLLLGLAYIPHARAHEKVGKPTKTEPQMVQLPAMIAYQKSRSQELKPLAEKLAKLADHKMVMATDGSIGCCIYLELDGSVRDGYLPYYVSAMRNGSASLRASSAEQMDKAIEALIKSGKREQWHAMTFPIGVLTNLPIVDSEPK